MPIGIYPRIKFNAGCFKKGKSPWNKGKTNIYSDETKNKISENTKKAWDEGRLTVNKSHFRKGQSPWNVGEVGTEHMKRVWNNPDFRKNQIEKKKLMWSTGEYMGNKGKSWFTDGTKNIMLASNDEVPQGFYKGRVFHG